MMTTVSVTDFALHVQNYLDQAVRGENIRIQLQNKQFVSLKTKPITVSKISTPKNLASKVIECLENSTELHEVLKFADECFDEKQELVNRLLELINLHYDEEDTEISIESLKSMLIFFSLINSDFNTPSMTLNENGYFESDWRKSNFELITLRFREENKVDYLIFKPSQHTEKPIILNNSMNLFDFIELIKDLKLMSLIKS